MPHLSCDPSKDKSLLIEMDGVGGSVALDWGWLNLRLCPQGIARGSLGPCHNRSLAIGISSANREVYPLKIVSSSVVAPGVSERQPMGRVGQWVSNGRPAIDPGPSTFAWLDKDPWCPWLGSVTWKSMVYGRNLVYTMSDLWSFVGQERTHRDAMKTVIALNCNTNVVYR